MKKSTLKWLIVAVSLIVIGCAVFCIIMATNHWDINIVSTTKEMVTNTFDISEDFNNISVFASVEGIEFHASDDEICKVVCFEFKDDPHEVTVSENTLTVKRIHSNKWNRFININFSFSSPKIMIYLPKEKYDELFIEDHTGSVMIPNDFTFSNININLNTGNINCKASISDEIHIKSSTGNIALEDLSASKISVSSSTGQVNLVRCEADEITVNTSTGNVNMTLLSNMDIKAHSSTGRVNVPSSPYNSYYFPNSYSSSNYSSDNYSSGKCNISTSTGNINVRII